MTSFHSDNWLFYDKRPTTVLSTLPLPEMADFSNVSGNVEDVTALAAVPIAKSNNHIHADSEIAKITVNAPQEQTVLSHLVAPQLCLVNDTKKLNVYDENIKNANLEPELNATAVVTSNGGGYIIDLDECTARSLTSSSCHSERSIIHLNCVVCFEDDSSPNLAISSKDGGSGENLISFNNTNTPTNDLG